LYKINKVLDFESIPVNAFVLWMLKYPNWQQKKNNQRQLYQLSLEEMVTPHTRRTDNGNTDRHTHRAMTAMGVT